MYKKEAGAYLPLPPVLYVKQVDSINSQGKIKLFELLIAES